MKEYTTGNDKVDYMAQFQITGNITPQIWYKTITRENGKPYLLAIAVLSEIVYWYRPMEIRDEVTGQFLGYEKKFKSDLLQRSYDQFAELFGESKRSVTDAILCLETLGVVKREFRIIEVAGKKYNNVLFIDFFPERLYELTYPNAALSSSSVSAKKDDSEENTIKKEDDNDAINQAYFTQAPPLPKKSNPYHKISGEGARNFGTRNTKNTKENITENILSSSSSVSTKKDDSEENAIKKEDDNDAITQAYFTQAPPLPKKSNPYHKISGEGARNFGTRNTKNTKENITENILSSSSSVLTKKDDSEENAIKDDDDDAITREYFTVAKGICPEETINAVISELKGRGSGYLQTIPPLLFLEICKNIVEYASPNIVNKSAYVKKCVDNMIAGQKLSKANAEYRIRAENSFLKQGYDADNWDDFEQKILSN